MFKKKVLDTAAKRAAGRVPAGKRALAAADAANKAKAAATAKAARNAAGSSGGGNGVPEAAALKPRPVPMSAANEGSPVSSLETILDSFRASMEPLADLDETLSLENSNNLKSSITAATASSSNDKASPSSPSSSSSSSVASASSSSSLSQPAAAAVLSTPPPAHITYHTFAASLTCEKKFYLMQERPDLMPKLSIGEAVHIDDAAGFNELARRWDRLQFGSKAIQIADQSFDQAAQHTEDVITRYFETTYAALGEQAPSLTIHRPAFAAPFGAARNNSHDADGDGDGTATAGSSEPLVLQARPAVLRYRPKDNQWVIIESQAIVDPLATASRAAQCLQRLHFSMLAFRFWVTQPHIPISLRKRFLSIDLDTVTAESLAGHRLEDTAAVSAPIDLKRSGVLHIRQYYPGPVTLMDCPPPRLVKYIQRLSLEDLLEVDRRNATKPAHHMSNGAGGAFGLQNIPRLDPAVLAARRQLDAAVATATKSAGRARARSVRQKDSEERAMFESQQSLMEALLRTRTVALVEKARGSQKQRERWTTFSEGHQDGHVTATYGHLERQLAEQEQQQQQQQAAEEVTAAATAGKGRGKGKKAAAAAKAPPPPPLEDLGIVPMVPCFSENIGAHCSRGDVCPFFTEGRCLPRRVAEPIAERDNHLFTLPSTAVSRKAAWWAEGMRTLRDVLVRYKQGRAKLTAPQLRYVKAVCDGEVAVNPKEIDKFFGNLRYPVFIIDFEATQFSLPPFQRVVAYQSVPFQFSIDVFQEDILTETPTHYDFLNFGKGYSPNTDPRVPLVEELVRIVQSERAKKEAALEASGEMARIREEEAAAAAVEEAAAARKPGRKSKKKPAVAVPTNKDGSPAAPLQPYDGCFVAHFASFEKSCLEKLGQLEDQHKDFFKGFYFLDTMDLIKKGFIHPNAGGSNSLKKVLPALCPDFQYGVFGSEAEAKDDDSGGEDAAATAAMEDVTGGDESSQKGENAMGVYRLWYHQEGGSTVHDFKRASAIPGSIAAAAAGSGGGGGSTGALVAATGGMPGVPAGGGGGVAVPRDARDKVWSMLRIQLLEYCSLDTKALYEIMREIWKEKEHVKDLPPADKTGWVFSKPGMREVSL